MSKYACWRDIRGISGREVKMAKNNTEASIPYYYLLAAGIFFLLLMISRAFLGGLEIILLRVFAILLLLSAVFFIFLPFSQLRKYGCVEEGQSYINTTQVADKGLYSLVRHPQYLGYILLDIGFVLLSLHWVKIILGMTALLFFYLQIKSEDAYCLRIFEKEFEKYCNEVPAINPIMGLWRKLQKSKEIKSDDQ